MNNSRTSREIMHGRLLALRDPETVWGWKTPAGELRAKRRAEIIIKAAALGEGKRVLEIGCGTGVFTELFAATGAYIVAVDLSADLLGKAQSRGILKERTIFLQKPFEDCDREGPFDSIVGSSVLHHLDLEKALCRIFELLKPGGIMSFAEPNLLNPQIFLERKLRFLPCFWYVSPDETAFVRPNLRRSLVTAGFENIRITPFDWLHPYTPSYLLKFIWETGACLEHIPILREFAGSLHICARRPCEIHKD